MPSEISKSSSSRWYCRLTSNLLAAVPKDNLDRSHLELSREQSVFGVGQYTEVRPEPESLNPGMVAKTRRVIGAGIHAPISSPLDEADGGVVLRLDLPDRDRQVDGIVRWPEGRRPHRLCRGAVVAHRIR